MPRAGGHFREADRRDFGIGEGYARHRGVIRFRVDAAQAARHDLPVVVGEMREPADASDIACTEHGGRAIRFERRRIDLQPAALGPCELGAAPWLGVGTPASRHQQPIGTHRGARLQMDHHDRALL
jgi:hypothetical protein